MSKLSRTFWTRPKGPLLLGVAACGACCVAPLVGLVLGAGAATTVAAILSPVTGILLAASAVLTIALVVRWRRAARDANACAVDGSCGCEPAQDATRDASLKPPTDAPIARTNDPSDRQTTPELVFTRDTAS
jgi:hypothetical protein